MLGRAPCCKVSAGPDQPMNAILPRSRIFAVVRPLMILRPATILPSPTLLSRRLMRRLMVTIPGHDPVLQLLSLADLAEAVLCSVERGVPGVFNIAPDSVIPLRAAVRIVRSHRVPFPRTLQRSEEHTSELQSPCNLVCRLLLEKKKII